MKKLGAVSALVAGLLVLDGPVFAHHLTGYAYDTKNPITLKGTVTEFDWSNPHAKLYFDMTDDHGAVKHWTCETASPNRLSRNGWTQDSLKNGDAITITLDPSRNGESSGYVERVVLANGTVLKTRDAPIQQQ
jgi:hypothetical protein